MMHYIFHRNISLPESYPFSVVEIIPLAPELRLAERTLLFSAIMREPSMDCRLRSTGRFISIFGLIIGCSILGTSFSSF